MGRVPVNDRREMLVSWVKRPTQVGSVFVEQILLSQSIRVMVLGYIPQEVCSVVAQSLRVMTKKIVTMAPANRNSATRIEVAGWVGERRGSLLWILPGWQSSTLRLGSIGTNSAKDSLS